MRSVYEPSGAIQAHVLQDVLRQHGIASHVQGEHLQSAIGELPAASLIRLLVDDDDYTAARRVLEEWERAEPMSDDELQAQDTSAKQASTPPDTATSPRWHPVWWVAIGAIGSVAVLAAASAIPVRTDTRDYNRDGVADETFHVNVLGQTISLDADRNFDGKIDLHIDYDRRGDPQTAQQGDDFNGTMETTVTYRQGNPQQFDTDTDGDGLVDARLLLENGVAQRNIYIHRNTGKPVRVEHLHLGKIQRVQIDTNVDGILDKEQTFDVNGVMSAERAI